jgi:hypothetical protein
MLPDLRIVAMILAIIEGSMMLLALRRVWLENKFFHICGILFENVMDQISEKPGGSCQSSAMAGEICSNDMTDFRSYKKLTSVHISNVVGHSRPSG